MPSRLVRLSYLLHINKSTMKRSDILTPYASLPQDIFDVICGHLTCDDVVNLHTISRGVYTVFKCKPAMMKTKEIFLHDLSNFTSILLLRTPVRRVLFARKGEEEPQRADVTPFIEKVVKKESTAKFTPRDLYQLLQETRMLAILSVFTGNTVVEKISGGGEQKKIETVTALHIIRSNLLANITQLSHNEKMYIEKSDNNNLLIKRIVQRIITMCNDK